MTRQVECSHCGWIGKRSRPPRAACPRCGHVVHDRACYTDLIGEHAPGVGLAIIVGLVATLMTYPMEVINPRQQVELQVVQLEQSDDGADIVYELRNDTPLTFTTLTLQLSIFRGFAHLSKGTPLPSAVVANLQPREVRQFTVSWPEGSVAELTGWKAAVQTFELPPGYSNRRIKEYVSVHVTGDSGTLPTPFPEELLHPPSPFHLIEIQRAMKQKPRVK